MTYLAQYLLDNYYTKYKGIHEIPEKTMLIKALDIHDDKIVVVHEGDKIIGVALFLMLTDETYEKINDFNVFNVDTLRGMLMENGDNIHFILVTTTGIKNIKAGIRAVKKAKHPKTISWWDPDNKRIHKYNMN